ncbi:MAG: DUF3592 domain-containing protein [Chloroflexi bacterium]|nr:DUF3592 domain-containing protein [Chloroflexota bacterium]MCI0579747.1 DUF3592 domain-containing protein [Chloroflexota bacterium]MCI0648892.1 DUF3592 domain-containing protein [Chloroflexota bacterium]MCI0728222.1 DUF3592 domain-containing protein [Chloroflexota bacterium]
MRLLFSSMTGIIGVVLLMIGCPFLAGAAGLYYFVDYSSSDWVLVPGTVTGMRQSEAYDSNSGSYYTTYCVSVEYTTADGQTIDANLNECSTPPQYERGDSVEVYYDPQEPQRARLKGGAGQVVGNIFVVLFGIIGAGLSFGGVVLLVAAVFIALRKNRNAEAG